MYRGESVAATEIILFLLFRKILNNLNLRYILLTKVKVQISFRSHYVSFKYTTDKTCTTEHYIDKNNASSRGTFLPLPPISISFYFEKQSWRKSSSTSHFSIIDPRPSDAARTFSLQFSCRYFLRRMYMCRYTFRMSV